MTDNYVMRHGKKIYIQTLDTGIGPRPKRRRRREFIMITRAQIKLLHTASRAAAIKIFIELLYLSFRARGAPVRLSNIALLQMGINRRTKYYALRELEVLGLVQIQRYPRKSPEIIIPTLKDEDCAH
jgi:hypothetical protein